MNFLTTNAIANDELLTWVSLAITSVILLGLIISFIVIINKNMRS